MPANGQAHVRIARPSRELAKAERFWVGGLGLEVLFRHQGSGGVGDSSLLMVGWPDAAWHLELVDVSTQSITPTPTVEDLFVVYLDGEVPADLVARLIEHGGQVVAAHNPYWNTWGVTIADPDGYLLVLSTRNWAD